MTVEPEVTIEPEVTVEPEVTAGPLSGALDEAIVTPEEDGDDEAAEEPDPGLPPGKDATTPVEFVQLEGTLPGPPFVNLMAAH